tara:strand:- start:10970 stop:11224 length:255 start_codon:yes stop_codon:yes gene_type:complete
MTKHLTYQPFAGVEYAFSPEVVEAKNERPDHEEYEPEVSLSGLRPVRVVERVNSFQRGHHTLTTTTRIITNAPISTNQTGETAQ